MIFVILYSSRISSLFKKEEWENAARSQNLKGRLLLQTERMIVQYTHIYYINKNIIFEGMIDIFIP